MLILLVFISLVGIYLALSAAILYHLWKFDIDPKTTKRASVVFVMVSLVLLASTAFVFFRTPWEELFR